ncbi:MAG: thioredoxin family protein [Patescibacteria group bacterium]
MADNKNVAPNTTKTSFLFGLFAGLAIVGVIAFSLLFLSTVDKTATPDNSGTVVNVQTPSQNLGVESQATTVTGITTFSEKKNAEICEENGKPVVYLFTTTWCPHCTWIKDTFDAVVSKAVAAGQIVAYHWEIDTGDDTLTPAVETTFPAAAQAVYQEFNPNGSIPTFVFGCKYYRVGNGHESADDLAAEKAEFEALITDLNK